ncbi:hypothetical protein PYW07_000517 [Mythimna separata]|uniref:Calcitonin receptor n=1 Tax=Mythimna separata TaxID=271217 RepID=A0AAD8E0M0_MYTSE|nr:hypothetical protein PYW07_000517 [Mythimna separata]
MQNATRDADYLNDPKYKWYTAMRKKCFEENITHSTILTKNYTEDGVWCPRTFDGFACWDEAPASTVAFQPCPEFIVGFDPKRYAYKKCTSNGSWFVNPDTNKTWTNYTTCVDVDDLDFRNIVNMLYVVGYSLSVAALLISVFIFLYFRVLQCPRIRIHVHLFMAFALSNIMWIVWYRAVVNQVNVVQNNMAWCQVLHVVTNYFMLTSYVWMFCEGLHLHIALVVVFVKDELTMVWFVLLGWGAPVLIILLYATVRFFTPGATERCWMDQSDTFWIIIIPVVISLMASTVFLINVVRVLLTKLHPAATQGSAVAVRKAARAALILIPLFGLHFILLPFRPLPDSPWEKTYQVVSAILTSLQGLCVAILFCFTNHDVVVAFKTYWSRMRANNEGIPMTGATGAESLVNTRDNVV